MERRYETTGERIAQLIEATGLTVEEVAAKAGLTTETVERVKDDWSQFQRLVNGWPMRSKSASMCYTPPIKVPTGRLSVAFVNLPSPARSRRTYDGAYFKRSSPFPLGMVSLLTCR